MLLLWRSHQVEKVRGAVAEFCLVCRDLRAFRFVDFEKVSRIYFIPVGRKLLGQFLSCRTCGALIPWHEEGFTSFADARETDLETLIAATRPDLRAERAARLALEERVRRSPEGFEAAARAQLLFEPFEALDPMVRMRLSSGMHFDAYSGLGCFGASAALIAAVALDQTRKRPPGDAIGTLMFVMLLFGVFTLVQFFLNPGRSARKRVVPLLARALAPLRPIEEEVAFCVEQCRKEKWKIGRLIRIDDVWKRIETLVSSLPPRSSPPAGAARPGS